MSASLTQARSSERGQERPVLRALPGRAGRMRRLPFIIVLASLLVVGMVGVLVLNTQLQNQAFEVRALQRRAEVLGYEQAALQSQIDAMEAPGVLAEKASRLGMRPNPHPAFIELPSGRILGVPQKVTGKEVPSLVVKSGTQIRAEQARARDKRLAASISKQLKAADKAAAKAIAAVKKQKAAEKKRLAEEKAAAAKKKKQNAEQAKAAQKKVDAAKKKKSSDAGDQ